MRQNLNIGKIFLNISAKYRVYYLKIARIFQQCTNCCEKESSVTTVAGLVNSFGTFFLHENADIFKNGLSKKGVEYF
jgi:hypothetical protein